MAANDPGHGGSGAEIEQPFLTHLIELRDRVMRMIIAVLLVFLVLAPFANTLFSILSRPLTENMPAGTSMVAIGVITPFLIPFKFALVLAIFIAVPYLLYQLWAFIAPGLYRHERRLALPVLASSTVLFYLGGAFAYYIVSPLIFAFMTSTAPEGVAVTPDISLYLDFVLTLFFAFGVAFEIPVITFVLVWMGITSPQALAAKRPYIVVGAFVIGMLLTPPDVISQSLLAVPMWILFELGVFMARVFVPRKPEVEEDANGSGHADYEPMSGQEMEAELDRMDSEERKDSPS